MSPLLGKLSIFGIVIYMFILYTYSYNMTCINCFQIILNKTLFYIHVLSASIQCIWCVVLLYGDQSMARAGNIKEGGENGNIYIYIFFFCLMSSKPIHINYLTFPWAQSTAWVIFRPLLPSSGISKHLIMNYKICHLTQWPCDVELMGWHTLTFKVVAFY